MLILDVICSEISIPLSNAQIRQMIFLNIGLLVLIIKCLRVKCHFALDHN